MLDRKFMSQPNHLFLESLEDRQLLASPWGAQARLIGQDLAAQRFAGINGSGYSIAVIDSGVDYNHPSLGGGWGKKVITGWDFDRNDWDPMCDSYAHGTGVAGMAAADPYDYKGYHYQGIAPGAKLIALRQHGSGGVANALKWVIANKSKYNIAAVNITDYAGGGNTDIWKSIAASIGQLNSIGVYITEPSGNSGSRSFGNTDPDQHEVGSVTLSDGISGFTNRGPGLDFLAPGDNVTVTYYDVGTKRHIYVDSGDGTSWSSPQIAGAATLIKQVNPGFNTGAITSILKDSAVWKYDSATGRSYPRLNLYGALILAYQRAGKSLPPAPQPSDNNSPQQPGGVTVSNPTTIGTTTTIQAEDFDAGASGTAYWDSTSGNQGGNNYRSSNVDVISLNDSGSTRGIGMVKAGEWLKYTVNVQSAGTYNLEFRTAALGAGGQFRLEVDGKDVTGALNIPDTHSWTSYTTVTKTGVSLTAGKHTLRLYFSRNGSSGYVGNFNYLKFIKSGTTTAPTPTPPATTPASIAPSVPTTLQVEDFDNGTRGGTWWDTDTTNTGGNNYRPGIGVDIISTNDSGSTRAVGIVKAGEWLKYTVNVAQAGTYDVEFRVAALGTGGQFRLEVDGTDRTGALNVPDTHSWTNYTTVTKTGVSLPVGKHTLRLYFVRNGSTGYVGNFNQIRFVPRTTAPGNPPSIWNLTPGVGATIQAEDFNGSYDKDSAHLGGGYRTTSVDIEKTLDTGAGYDVGYMQAGEWLSYNVNVTAAGTFNLDARIASPATGARFHVEVDGRNVTGSINFTNTGGFQTWTTLRKSGISMAAGKHTIKVVVESTGNQKYAGNLNWIKFS
jgi:hypothetical protein